MPLVRKFGPVFPLDQPGQFESFAMTAAAIKALDLVITVDTSIAHLAGALGVPTWLLLPAIPDFRWGSEGEQNGLVSRTCASSGSRLSRLAVRDRRSDGGAVDGQTAAA